MTGRALAAIDDAAVADAVAAGVRAEAAAPEAEAGPGVVFVANALAGERDTAAGRALAAVDAINAPAAAPAGVRAAAGEALAVALAGPGVDRDTATAVRPAGSIAREDSTRPTAGCTAAGLISDADAGARGTLDTGRGVKE